MASTKACPSRILKLWFFARSTSEVGGGKFVPKPHASNFSSVFSMSCFLKETNFRQALPEIACSLLDHLEIKCLRPAGSKLATLHTSWEGTLVHYSKVGCSVLQQGKNLLWGLQRIYLETTSVGYAERGWRDPKETSPIVFGFSLAVWWSWQMAAASSTN